MTEASLSLPSLNTLPLRKASKAREEGREGVRTGAANWSQMRVQSTYGNVNGATESLRPDGI